MMIEVRELRREDHRKAVQFAITGMHFDWYLDSKFLLNLYGTYFWYSELLRSTQVVAVYTEDGLAGVLLAEVRGEKKKYRSFWKGLYVKVFELLQNALNRDGGGKYLETNEEMRAEYAAHHDPDGELLFLAADPQNKAKGIGSRLLYEFESHNKGKTIYLYTDNACTYQFYEHRGFQCSCEREIVLDMGRKKVPLKCLLYSKTIP